MKVRGTQLLLPEAHISHRISSRIRIKIQSKKGDPDYFSHVKKEFSDYGRLESVEVNTSTGSLLLVAVEINKEDVAKFANSKDLFDLKEEQAHMPLSRKLMEPVECVSKTLHRSTKGEIDLPGLAFLSLLGVGVYQVARGNFVAPPWYTAFWYGLGIFTKLLADKKSSDFNSV